MSNGESEPEEVIDAYARTGQFAGRPAWKSAEGWALADAQTKIVRAPMPEVVHGGGL